MSDASPTKVAATKAAKATPMTTQTNAAPVKAAPTVKKEAAGAAAATVHKQSATKTAAVKKARTMPHLVQIVAAAATTTALTTALKTTSKVPVPTALPTTTVTRKPTKGAAASRASRPASTDKAAAKGKAITTGLADFETMPVVQAAAAKGNALTLTTHLAEVFRKAAHDQILCVCYLPSQCRTLPSVNLTYNTLVF